MNWHHQHTINLHLSGECALLGVNPASGTIYAEEWDDATYAQVRLNADGDLIDRSTDRLRLPPDIVTPALPDAVRLLNRVGARWRGLRAEDRTTDLVEPLAIAEKMALIAALNLSIPPILLLGIAESRVVCAAPLNNDGDYLVCRMVRLAYALAEPQRDVDGAPYDYDTLPLHIAHQYHAPTDAVPPLHTSLNGLAGVTFQHPLDCVAQGGRVVLAEGSANEHPNRIHIFRYDDSEPTS